MFFYVRRLLLAVLIFFNNQTLQSINGNPAGTTDPSPKTANTESLGLLNWVPKWCRKGYNDLFGDDGIITAVIPSFFWRPKKQPIGCCCRLLSENDQSTPEKDVREIGTEKDKKSKSNKCVQMIGKGLKNTGMCVLAVSWFCGRFVVDACKEIALVSAGLLIVAPALGCVKVAECFGCDGSNQKPKKKKEST